MKWVVKEQPDRELLDGLIQALNVPKIIGKILVNRGITSFEDARRFFRTDWEDLHNPLLMQDMDKAVERIKLALSRKERFFIYGDYDVDGITAVSLLYLFLTRMGGVVHFYIPDRMREGYGLSEVGIRHAERVGATLLISVDCGITGVEEVALAKTKGIDVIVSDHHEPGAETPKAVAILDPKRGACSYPFQELAGVGVAYKLIQAVCESMGLDEDISRDYVDLVALGSAADIVPLVNENRLLVKKGLEKINRMDRLGIRALAESAGLSGKTIGTGQVVFIMAPRINAVGRLGNAERAVRLLITNSEQQAKNIAGILESENRNRKNIDEETYQGALAMLETEYDSSADRAVVLAKEGWHPGVIGIVASRISEKIYRPTIMISLDDGVGKGSARSISKFDIYSALKRCEDHLIGYGGHRYAAGLTIRTNQVEQFKACFKQVASETLEDEDLVQTLSIDAEISLPEITPQFMRLLDQFAPFGPQNMRPVFASRNVQVIGSPRIVGSNHLKFRVRQRGMVFDAIGFDLGDLLYRLTPGESNLDMAYVIEENTWGGQTRLQLRVKDLM